MEMGLPIDSYGVFSLIVSVVMVERWSISHSNASAMRKPIAATKIIDAPDVRLNAYDSQRPVRVKTMLSTEE